ncbi:MAG: LysR family transcriptional regulator [Eubacterium sp.]|nr:LysR family transcriptional regulator [Eubacterium sp.]
MDNNLDKYLAFVKTVEKGSITKAAIELNYAQSSVSKMIADLEKECGFALLERGKKGVNLTSSGKEILPLARNILNNYFELEGYINKLNKIESGSVRIGTFSSVAINRLPDIFTKFQKDFPNIEYEMLLGDYIEVEKWIDEGRVDFGFLRLPTEKRFDTMSLIQDEYMVVLPKNHILAKEENIDIKKLNSEPFLLLEHGGKTEVSNLLDKYNVKPNIKFTTWEDFAIMAMVEKGLGVSILPSLILENIPYDIEIRPLKIPFYRDIGIAMKDKKRLTPAAKKFIEYLT